MASAIPICQQDVRQPNRISERRQRILDRLPELQHLVARHTHLLHVLLRVCLINSVSSTNGRNCRLILGSGMP